LRKSSSAASRSKGVGRLVLLSDVSQARHVLDMIKPYPDTRPGRARSKQVVDSDDDPTIYQTTSIAIGHVLTIKQVWRADGYSLGDLLYSLPLMSKTPSSRV
jgi:hypothetical protein